MTQHPTDHPLPAQHVPDDPLAPRRGWVEQIMGMPISIHVRGPGAAGEAAAGAVARAFDRLREADAVFSTYRADSQLLRLERGELALQDCAPELVEVIHLCDEARRRTDGWFDARDLPGPDGRRRFDPTGLVKAWAVERADAALADLTGHDTLINAGGDVLVRCAGPASPAWRIGIEDPDDRTRMLAVVPVRDGAVATSGAAARGAHILDPHTGRPVAAGGSVSVVGPSLLWADVYATAAFARGPQDAIGWLAGLPGYSAIVVDAAGVVTRVP